MAQQLADRKDIDFVLWEQMESEKILKNEKYHEYTRKTCDLIINEARSLAIKELLPTMSPGDKEGVQFENGTVKVPECFHKPFNLLKEGEWPSLKMSPEMGGQGAPHGVSIAASEYLFAANWSIYCYATMGLGTALMIDHFGTPEQQEMYVEKLTSAEWGGTMLLTESDAGSDVGALTTSATKNSDGTYSLSGNKIFITAGEHDLTENIIHPVLARIEGDPNGTKGISIFLVPKYFVNPDGSLGDRNDIYCTGIEEKHGIHGSSTCTMSMGSKGNCVGYLLGEERKGMKIMFYMMNDARLNTGLQGFTMGSAAYLDALDYAKKRIQGRDLADFSIRDAKSVPIIKHPDIRRNLIRMKAYVSGMRSFFYYASRCGDELETLSDQKEKSDHQAFFDLLTPIIKEYMAVMGHDICIQAMQVLGGAGYTKDYLVEQFARDCKIASIYEGSSGIQAMDLLARKINANKGAAFGKLVEEINSIIFKAKAVEALVPLAQKLEIAVDELGKVTLEIVKKAGSSGMKTAFAHSLPYLHVVGDVIMGWMLLWRAVVASEKLEAKCKKKEVVFYNGQIKTAEFFIRTELVITMGKMAAVREGCSAAIDIEDDGF